jgi:hypothetical protein
MVWIMIVMGRWMRVWCVLVRVRYNGAVMQRPRRQGILGHVEAAHSVVRAVGGELAKARSCPKRRSAMGSITIVMERSMSVVLV